jgi:hypothetical protein
MDLSKIKLPKGIKTRKPYETELEYFKRNINVAGMATEDNKVILNPYSNLDEKQYQSVAINEAARIAMRDPQNIPNFDLTEEQKRFLDTTSYRTASETDRKSTIAARILSKDSSGGIPTSEQSMFISNLKKVLGIDSE